jgi:hypothetical protein
VSRAGLVGGDTTNHLGAVGDGLLGVESALLAGETLQCETKETMRPQRNAHSSHTIEKRTKKVCEKAG